ncbi:filament-like plant protein 3 isoform X2 [Pistacia vera]|uniref:filament-like plant protein 3 isoform X2 n=1 Tax=Pistacia vera TaxID=55513 RepID=UPI0012631961|nr:filament-like plant protein 3 isoform X2 [Pistacia vera]
MDRRSWLWRRKSSEKSPGETESSGSISSLSERFSDDQAFPTHISHSPEVTSKGLPADEEVTDNVRSLTDKLSAALLNISAKEDLVNQHAKVAEEAVSGWEKAQREVSSLKQQLEAAAQKNSALEDRAAHLDGALKECVRQLRQARDEQQQRIQEAVAEKTRKWESEKSDLQKQLFDLQKQLENAKELELRIIERDLSTKAAETASKQHLESIKKLAKVEAECRRLKAVAHKAITMSDQKSFTASSVGVESIIDSQSDSGDRLLAVETDTHKMSGLETNECGTSHTDSWASALIPAIDKFKNEKALSRKFMVPSMQINLMDDFLEMERLAALPDTESRNICLDAEPVSKQLSAGESSLKAELEAMIHQTAELEEKLEKMEAEKMELEMALTESEKQFERNKNQLREGEVRLVELQTQLALANKSKQAMEVEIMAANAAKEMSESQLRVVEAEMKTHLALANKSKQALEEEMKAAKARKEVAESRLRDVEAEMKTLHSRVASLEEEVEKERTLSDEKLSNFQKTQDELIKMKNEAKLQHSASSKIDLKILQEKELGVAANKFAECQKTIASLSRQLRSLATLEDFLDSDTSLEFTGEVENGGKSWSSHLSNRADLPISFKGQ